MDYKYIEQLLEHYWQCETSIEEENILRTFFSQKDVPAELAKYRSLFNYEQTMKYDDKLGDDFDDRILQMIGEAADEKPKARTLTMRLMPLFKAAAVVAIIVTLVNAAQLSMSNGTDDDDINYSSYTDTFSDPSVAYDKVENVLELVSEGFCQARLADSVKMHTNTLKNDSTIAQ